MPAGSLVTASYQVELRATLMGDTTIYALDESRATSWQPLGVMTVKSADVDLDLANGSYGSPDFLGPLIITIPFVIDGTTDGVAATAIQTMRSVWAPSTTDIPLYQQLPGIGKFYVNGRPRSPLAEDWSQVRFGLVRFLATFVALDATIH